MVLLMSRPAKHPKTGIYYFRKAVPESLRPVLGKVEEKRSLGTKDPAEAKRLHAEVAAEVERMWQGLRRGPQVLMQKQIVALAGEVYRDWVEAMSDEPGETVIWDHVLRLQRQARAAGKLAEWWKPSIDELLLKKGLVIDEASRTRLVEEVDKAFVQGSELLRRRSMGDYRPDPDGTRFPEWEALADLAKPSLKKVVPPTLGAVSMTDLVEAWWREAKAAGLKISTYESYRASMTKLVEFLGHDDAGRVTEDDVIRFKDFRLAEVHPRTKKLISPKTVKDSDLAGLRRVFDWAVKNKKLASNPAKGVTLKLGKPVKLRSKGFTDEEARAILRATLHPPASRESPKVKAAKRWLPWLCAYTGARVGEMAQLRRQDIRQEGDWWVLRITPEAGPVKTNEAREVVLHPHLIELGFPEFVERSKPGHLFITPKPDGSVEGPLNTVKNRVADAVRETITDPNVAPNHGWRHRFKTIGMEAGISPRILDAIQGHAPRSAGDTYGDVTIPVIARAIASLPRIEIR
jgi:integrase